MSDVVLEGFSPSHQRLLADYFANELELDPCALPIEEMEGAFAVAARPQLVGSGRWYRSDHYHYLRKPMGLDEGLYSKMRTSRRMYGLCVLREKGDRPFGARERQVLQYLNENTVQLLMLDEPRSPLDELAPRYRAVAERLMAGDSVKQAARFLGLSPHTVAQYTKMLHRHFGVSSRAELLLKLIKPSDQ